MNFGMNHAPGAESIAQPVGQQSRALPLYHGCLQFMVSGTLLGKLDHLLVPVPMDLCRIWCMRGPRAPNKCDGSPLDSSRAVMATKTKKVRTPFPGSEDARQLEAKICPVITHLTLSSATLIGAYINHTPDNF